MNEKPILKTAIDCLTGPLAELQGAGSRKGRVHRLLAVLIAVLSPLLFTVMDAPTAHGDVIMEAKYTIGDYGYPSTPAIGDIDKDGHPEIVYGTLTTNTGKLVVIRKYADNTVELVWSLDLGGPTFAPAVADIDGDGYGEIVVYVFVGSGTGGYYDPNLQKVYAVNHDGSVLWESVVGAPPHRNGGGYNMWESHCPALGDVDGDGYVDAAIYLGDGNVRVLSGVDGAVLWTRNGGGYTHFWDGKTGILDLDEDGSNEVLSAGGNFMVYRSDGTLWWQGTGSDFGVADLELDGSPEVVTTSGCGSAGTSGYMRVYSHDGVLKWSKGYPSYIISSSGPAIADLDFDGMPEIAAGGWDSHVRAFNGDGSLLWDSGYLGVGEWDSPDLTATDLNGDGAPEITVISDDVGPIILDGATGTVIYNSWLNINENEHSPSIADVDNDGRAEVVLASGYGSGAAYPYHMLIFGDDLNWVPTKAVWNQMSYYGSNIKEDMTITGDYTPWKTFNVWRSQTPELLGVLLDVFPESQEIEANHPSPQTVTYQVTVKNTGMLTDTFDLSVSGSMPGWEAQLSAEEVTLDGGESTTVQLDIKAPPELPEGLPVIHTAVAASQTDPEVTNAASVMTYTPPPPPPTGHETITTFIDGNGATVELGQPVRLAVEVMDVVDNLIVTGPGFGAVNFFVAGIAVGSDTDDDSDGVFEIDWTPGLEWIHLDIQGLLAVYSGIDRPEPEPDLLTSYGVGIITILAPQVLTVMIDIKPGSWPNPVNPTSRGVIPVAILTTSTAMGEKIDFDASTVDPSSVRFGPSEAIPAHNKGHLEDVDGDGDLDMVLHFRTQETGIKPGDTEAWIKGNTFDLVEFKGSDAVMVLLKK